MIRKRKIQQDPETQDFKITPLEEENPEALGAGPAPLTEMDEEEEYEDAVAEEETQEEASELKPSDLRAISGESGKVAIGFEKFIKLLTTHDFEEVMKGHETKEVIIDIDLLADLANSHDEEPNRKVPMFFILGLFIGAVVVFLLVKLLS